MDVTEAAVRAWTESSDGKWVIIRLAEPVEVECSEPGCMVSHTADVLLMDLGLNAFVQFTTTADAKEHVADLDETVGWHQEMRTWRKEHRRR
jgi:hypothetical protein